MNRRWAVALLLGVLLVLALPFAAGYFQGRAHDCPSILFVDEAPPENVDEPPIQFSSLSEQRQHEFERAVEGDRAEVESTEGAWVDTRFVHYRGTNYSSAVAVC